MRWCLKHQNSIFVAKKHWWSRSIVFGYYNPCWDDIDWLYKIKSKQDLDFFNSPSPVHEWLVLCLVDAKMEKGDA